MEKYSRIKQLGKGSFGAAFLVKRYKDNAFFVVKEVSLLKMTAKEKEEARHEVRILSQLSHPNITQYTEHVEKNGVLSIVMEFADGGDLYQRIKASAAAKYARKPPVSNNRGGDDDQYESMLKSRGPGGSGMSEDLIMHYFSQICLAIDYLHSKHILHRDIKSMNVFLTSRGTVKVGDFGISTILRNTIGMAKTVCGTPYYFSPELCKSKPYNNKSDVWALGVVLYEMANVKHPFDASSMSALMNRICKGAYVALPSAPANNPSLGFTKGFLSLIAKCLDVNVATRYNIKQVLSTDILRTALGRLEKDLMLATVCKVRLQTVIGHYDQRDMQKAVAVEAKPSPTSAVPPANPSAFPQPNPKLAPKPLAGNPSRPIPVAIPAPPQPQSAQPPPANNRVAAVQLRSEASQVQKEIEKVDKLIAYLKQPSPNPQAPPPSAVQMPPPRQAIVAATPRDKEDATRDYIKKHQELQQIMAAHKKKVEENLRKRQEQEEAYQREVLARRHQYQIDHRPKPVAKPVVPSPFPAEVPPPAIKPSPPPVKADPVKLPPISTPRSIPVAANCLPAEKKKDRHAIAAEAWAEEQKRQDLRKKAAAEEKRGVKSVEPSAAAASDVQGMGDYFDRRRREQDRASIAQSPVPVPAGRNDMPAGVQARRQLLGEERDVKQGKMASPSPRIPTPQSRSNTPTKCTEMPIPKPRSLSPIALAGRVTPVEPTTAKPVDRRPSVGRQPSVSKEYPPQSLKPLPLNRAPSATGINVEEHVKAIEGQLKDLEVKKNKASPSIARIATPPPQVEEVSGLDALLQSFTKREESPSSFLPPLMNRTNAPSLVGAAPPETVGVVEGDMLLGGEGEEDEEAAQTQRQEDYGNMLKHIQGLNAMLGEIDRRRKKANEERVIQPVDAEEVVTEVIKSSASADEAGNVATGAAFEEEVIDTSCYIQRGDASDDSGSESDDDSSDSDSSISEPDVDTILDATVRGALSKQDFGDVEPLTPSRSKAKALEKGGVKGKAALVFDDDNVSPNVDNGILGATSFFRLAHLCGVHFDGHSPTFLNGDDISLPTVGDLSPLTGSEMPKEVAQKVSMALEKYIVVDKIAAALSEDAVTPKDKLSEGPRYRREAAAFTATLICRLLNSIGHDEMDSVAAITDDGKELRDDEALQNARRLIQLLLQASMVNPPKGGGGSQPASVALTSLLSACRRGLGAPPSIADNRRVPSTEAAVEEADSYIRSLCDLISQATTWDGPKSVAVKSDGEDGYFADDINEIIALSSQLLYFKSLA